MAVVLEVPVATFRRKEACNVMSSALNTNTYEQEIRRQNREGSTDNYHIDKRGHNKPNLSFGVACEDILPSSIKGCHNVQIRL